MVLEPFRAHFDQAQWIAKIDLDRNVCDPSLFQKDLFGVIGT